MIILEDTKYMCKYRYEGYKIGKLYKEGGE